MLEITLRGKQYKAEHLTDLNYLALGNLFIDEKTGNFALESVENYESLSQSDRLRLSGPLMKKLTDPKEKGAIACSLAAIFPSLPKELVSYSNGDFTLNITLEELTRITLDVASDLGKGKTPQKQEELTPVQEAFLVRIETNIERIEQELNLGGHIETLLSSISNLESLKSEVEKRCQGWSGVAKRRSDNCLKWIQELITKYQDNSEDKAIAKLEKELSERKAARGFAKNANS